jgi:D-alanine-D-alanine ligase
MRIGITYDLKSDTSPRPDQPDDFQEEFDSPVTIEAIAAVLRAADHEVIKLGDGGELIKRLLSDPPDFVFNMAEGEGIGRSREARVPAVLEMLGIPYTGSDPLTLAVTLDKDCAKRLVASTGVAVAKDCVIIPGREDAKYSGPFPAIVKPAWEGSSKGIRHCCVVDRADDLTNVINSLWLDHRQPVMVEEFISGDEVTVGILGNDPPRILGAMRVLPRQPTEKFVYSLEVKRDFRNQVRYESPPALPPQHVNAIEEAALRAYEVLGCRDVARVDFRVREGTPYFLEVNPLPGLNPESSDLVILAELVGWTYGQLIETILIAAVDRQKK